MSQVALDDLKADFPLYARYCLKIEPKEGGLVPFELNPIQLRTWAAIQHERGMGRAPRIVILKSRRMGISSFTEGLAFWTCHMNEHRSALVLAYDVALAQDLFDRCRTFYQNLPETVRPKKKLDSKSSVRFADTMSWLKVAVAGKRAGRGYGGQIIHVSELAWMEWPKATLDAVLVAADKSAGSAVIVESTPNGQGDEFHRLCLRAQKPDSGWVFLFFPWFDDTDNRTPTDLTLDDLDAEEKKLVAEHGVTVEQLAWRRRTIGADFRGDVQMFMQEYPSDPVSCFLASGRPVFDLGMPYYRSLVSAEYVQQHPLPAPSEIQADPGAKHPKIVPVPMGRLRIYREPQLRHLYTIGADCASGDLGGDYTPIVVLNEHTMDVDAVWFSKAPSDRQAVFAMMLGAYYNDAKICVEANNHGIGFVQAIEGKYGNLYWRKVLDSGTGKMLDRVGWLTSASNRNYAIDLCRWYVRDHMGIIRDPDLVQQMSEMFYDGDRADHPEGGYDDLVFALAMALVAHQGSPDRPLAPIPLPDIETAITAYRRALLFGDDPAQMPDAIRLGLTCDDLQRLDDEHTRRREREEATIAMTGEL